MAERLPAPGGRLSALTIQVILVNMGQMDTVSAATSGSLDWSHQDPFDRMIVAQALRRGWTIVTRDRALLAFVGDDGSMRA